jgi:hypothetical protein
MVTYQVPSAGAGPSNIFYNLNASGAPGSFAPAVKIIGTNVGGFTPIPAQSRRQVDAEPVIAWDLKKGTQGRVYLAFTQRPSITSANTDILLLHSDDNGAHWSTPVRVNNDPGTNSQFEPSIAVDPSNGNVAVGWYDARNDPANVKTQFFVAVSSDGGAHFAGNIPVSLGSSNATDPNLDAGGKLNQYGDYTGIDVFNGTIIPIWTDNSAALLGNPDLPNFDMAASTLGTAFVT